MVAMERAVITAPERDLSREQVDLIKRTVAKDASDLELELFLNQAKRLGLDPLVKQIHLVKRGSSATIQVAIDGYRLVAQRTGVYAGNDDVAFTMPPGMAEFDKGARPAKATITVWKFVQGQRCPFTATARWEEYVPQNENQMFLWKRMPFLMLGKCAEALALRKAFPAELSGTYVDEEMHQADGADAPAVEVVVEPEQRKAKEAGLRHAYAKRFGELFEEAAGLGLACVDKDKAKEAGVEFLEVVKADDSATILEKGRKLKAAIDAAKTPAF